jgi:hypothetical protein
MALPDRARRYRGPRLRLFLWVAIVELIPASVYLLSGDFELHFGQWIAVSAIVAVIAVAVWAVLRTDLVIGPAGVTRSYWGFWRHWRWSRIEELKEYASFDPEGRRHVFYDVHGGGRRLFRFTSSMEGAAEAARTIRDVLEMHQPQRRRDAERKDPE